MTGDDLEEALKRFLPLRNDFVAEPVGEYLDTSRACEMGGDEEKGEGMLTFPGSWGIVTLVLSFSRMSRNASKSEYRRRTTDCWSLKAGMLVYLRGRKIRDRAPAVIKQGEDVLL